MQNPLFPTKSDWTLPELPNLKHEKILGLDIETRDPDLKSKGPGVRRNGYMIGLSVATQDRRKWYFPFGHQEGQQFDKGTILAWAKENLCSSGQAKVGANILYDLDYLYHEGVKVSGPFYDVQVAEPLIDENKPTYKLDALSLEYLREHKNEELLREICRDFGYKGDPQAHLWRLDPKYVGPYAESDAEQPLRIFEKQKRIIKEQNLEEIFDIETRLIPMLLHMRQVGVPVDVGHVLQLHKDKVKEFETEKTSLDSMAREPVDIWAAASIAKIFDAYGYSYPTTPKKGDPSFVKGWLEKHDWEVAKKIVRCRVLDKFRGTFLEGSLLEMLVGNRIHCQFNQLKSDDSGTVSGRFSSSNPNLQFIPTRTDEGKEIRKCFIPDEGYSWFKADYSQIEIRVLAHYAMGKGAAEIQKAFWDNPLIDFHQWCAEKARVTRQGAKTINFGLIYGMGVKKLAKSLGITEEEASEFIRVYFSFFPFLKHTVDTATQVASDRGWVKTAMGRRRRFDLWEPRDKRLVRRVGYSKDPVELKATVNAYTAADSKLFKGIQRAFCYKAFNAVDQGTSADIMKKAMVDVWESGVCRTIIPYITVHDELDFGSPRTKEGEEAAREIKDIMEKTYPLKVPVIVDLEKGPSWGEVKKLG